MPRFSPIRAAVMLLTVGFLLIALVGRVAYLQTYGREQTIRRAERQQHQTEMLPARRGVIFDSVGLVMAGTVQTQSLYIDPKFTQDEFQLPGHSLVEMDEAMKKLGVLIDKDPLELLQMLGDRSTSRFVRVADRLDENTCAAIEKLNLPGVGLIPMNERYYPMGAIAAHVLGGVGGEGVGLEGLELQYESILAGKNGFKRTLKDARRRPIAVAADDYLPPKNGQHLILTIDSNIQMIVEQELAAACEQFHAPRGEAVVMDPQTGDVLALANYPTFNPQNLNDSKPQDRRDRALTDPYEPGSTIKPFIVGPSLMWKLARLDEVFPINGETYHSSLRAKPVTDVHGYHDLALWDVLVKSSNIGMTMLGEKIGRDNVYKALKNWNFGEPTGIELPGEDGGKIKPLNKWANSDVVSAVQGYSVMVTPLQLARGMCAYANGGKLVTPHIVKGIMDADGNVVDKNDSRGVKLYPQVIDPTTAAQMRRVLCDVVIRGTAPKARSMVWNIFGKTGTAHISKAGVYNDQSYTSSFIGGAPAENPRLVVAFVVHDADKRLSGGHAYGGTIAAPAAGAALERALAYLQVPASPDLDPPPPHIANLLWSYDPKIYQRNNKTASASAHD